MIPFLELQKINAPYQKIFERHFKDFLAEGNYILGNAVSAFETDFAAYCGTDYGIGTGNGLDALRLIFEGLKIQGKLKVGDAVLLAANSYIATVLAVIHSGLEPVFVEVEEATFNIDFEKIITPDQNVKALVSTHLYGHLGPVEKISAFAKNNNLLFIEDASQAHGAELNGKKAGSFGEAAAFSLYPTKNLGALGDAGIVTTSNKQLAEILCSLRNYGKRTPHDNQYPGFNSRLDSLQAFFLKEKLKDLDAHNLLRRKIASRYLAEITNENIQLPFWDTTENHVFHLFVIQVKNRTHFLLYMEDSAIGYALHYPVVPYKQEALKEYAYFEFPVAQKIANSCVSIPLNTALSNTEITRIIEVLNAYHA